MDDINKKELSETDICDLYITPAIKDAGWDPMRQIRREVTLTPGPVIVRGNLSSRNKKKRKFISLPCSAWERTPLFAFTEKLVPKRSVGTRKMQPCRKNKWAEADTNSEISPPRIS